MDFEGTFRRFFGDWRKFALMGAGPLLVGLVTGLIGVIAAVVLVGPSVFSAVQSEMMGYEFEPTSMISFFFSFIALFVVILVLGLVGGGLASAGLIGSIVGYRRGEAVSLGAFWSYATRYFGRIVLLGILYTLIMLASGLMLVIPILGWLAWMVWVPTALVTLAIYPAYLIVDLDYGVTQAMGVGFRVLTRQFGESVISGLMMLGISLVIGLIAWIPLLGWIAAALFGETLIVHLFVERFESVVRPRLSI